MNASKTDQLKDYVIVAMVEPQESAGYRFSEWPLHITLLPWFSAPSDTDVTHMCEQTTQDLRPFTVSSGQREHFGQRRLPVKLIQPSTEILELHQRLLRGVYENNWEITGRYTDSQFRPHVTQKRGKDVGDTMLIDSLYIVEKLGQGYREIVGKVVLKND